MNFGRRIVPEHFLPQDWDSAWALGWFRMRQSLFTAHFLEFDGHFYPAVWLRVGLGNLVPDRKCLALRKLNRNFRVEFRPSDPQGPSPAQEDLYTRYRLSVPFEPAPSLNDLLIGEAPWSRFPTHEINLYDGETLVATGIYDLGDRAMAGIVCFYDPDYRKHSLGKYLMYLKMDHGKARGLDWFYPGYAAPGQPRFDYKWEIGTPTLEYLDLGSGGWLPRNPSDPVPNPLEVMEKRLGALGALGPVRYYLHLDINLNPQVSGMDLFDFPVFIDLQPGNPGPLKTVVVYDPRDHRYHLLQCQSVYHFDDKSTLGPIFESDLLLVRKDLLATPDPGEMLLGTGVVKVPG